MITFLARMSSSALCANAGAARAAHRAAAARSRARREGVAIIVVVASGEGPRRRGGADATQASCLGGMRSARRASGKVPWKAFRGSAIPDALPLGLETSVATPSNFEVPPDRPHFAVWPRRLPRAVVAPETSLWFNLEVAATRYPGQAAYLFFGRALTYRQLRDDADRARRLAAARRRRQGRPGRGLHAELPAVPDRALRHPARRCRRRSGQSDEPRRGVQALHQRSRRPRS